MMVCPDWNDDPIVGHQVRVTRATSPEGAYRRAGTLGTEGEQLLDGIVGFGPGAQQAVGHGGQVGAPPRTPWPASLDPSGHILHAGFVT